MKSSIYCGHANECPQACPCDIDCSCRAGMCRGQPSQQERDPEVRIAHAAMRLNLSINQVDIMLHALGIQHRDGDWSQGGWRNYYVITSETCDSYVDCRSLVDGGWMWRREFPSDLGGGFTFYVTVAGKHAIRGLGWEVTE